MNREYLNTIIEVGKEATKEANKTNTAFFDTLSSVDFNNDLDVLIFKNKKAQMNANNSLANGCRRLANKEINKYFKELKENN